MIAIFGGIPDPDTFYHAKLAEFLSRGILIKDFSWLPFTSWSTNWIDHHFLYHVLLVPFVWATDALTGIRIAAVFFAALAITAVIIILKKLNVKHAWAYGVVLLLTEPFVFRMSLAKAPAISLLALLIGWYFAVQKKYAWLVAVGFLYVWLYDGWPLLLVVAGAVTIARRFDLRPVLYATLGILLGIIINPYFPANLQFFLEHIVRIGFTGAYKAIPVGGEWASITAWQLLWSAPWVHILAIAAFFSWYVRRPRLDATARSAALLAVIFYMATLFARRNVEYFVPFAVIAGAQLNVPWKFKWKLKYKMFLPIIAAVAALIIARDGLKLYDTYRGGYSSDHLRGAAEWIKNNVSPGEIIMHSDWGEFPMLWFWNDKNRYIAGLDPAFFYDYDPARYRDWEKITSGKAGPGVGALIHDRFNARFVLVGSRHEKLRTAIEADGGFVKVFHDDDADVYSYRNSNP